MSRWDQEDAQARRIFADAALEAFGDRAQVTRQNVVVWWERRLHAQTGSHLAIVDGDLHVAEIVRYDGDAWRVQVDFVAYPHRIPVRIFEYFGLEPVEVVPRGKDVRSHEISIAWEEIPVVAKWIAQGWPPTKAPCPGRPFPDGEFPTYWWSAAGDAAHEPRRVLYQESMQRRADLRAKRAHES